MESSLSAAGIKEQGAEASNASEIKDLLEKLTATVEKLASNTNPPPAKHIKPAAEAESDSEQDDYDDDDDDAFGRKKSTGAAMTFNISEETGTFVEACFNLPRPVENKTRKAWLLEFGLAEGNGHNRQERAP